MLPNQNIIYIKFSDQDNKNSDESLQFCCLFEAYGEWAHVTIDVLQI
jgi:hypothetical protein